MGYLLGTDEAGYGPNLGPLVISATLWHDPAAESLADLSQVDLYKRFDKHIVADAPRKTPGKTTNKTIDSDDTTTDTCDAQKLWIADSKRLYKPHGGVHHLERGVLGSLQAIAESMADSKGLGLFVRWQDIWQAVAPRSLPAIGASPWYKHFDEPLPVDADESEIRGAARILTDAFEATSMRLVAVRSAVVFEQNFNELLNVYGNKSDVLSKTTLRLVTELIDGLPRREPVLVNCDKHGGRNRYSALIQAEFPDTLVEVHDESRPISIYRFGQANGRVEMRFQAKGESFLPAALASMTSKYLRELAMRAFNDFWCRRVDDLQPTAGYPVDARRFHAQIKPTQEQLRISDISLWRRK